MQEDNASWHKAKLATDFLKKNTGSQDNTLAAIITRFVSN
jgi:hypothetical protein